MAAPQLFALGFGYTAETLARNRSAEGLTSSGTTRSREAAEALRTKSWNIAIWPGEDVVVPEGAHWLISVPPDEEGCPVFRAFADRAGSAASLNYLSTTGVYGNLDGGWATEGTPRNPLSREAKNRARAEDQWGPLGASIFRLPGIYGPGRSALERVRVPGARRIVKAGQVFSRIHVADLAEALRLAMTSNATRDIYNVCDDESAPADEVLAYAAELLGMPPPPAVSFEDAGLSPAAQRFYAECKRVSNAKVKAAFGWKPFYPTYREGLRDCLARERQSPPFDVRTRR